MANNRRRPINQRRHALADLAADALYAGFYARVSTEQQAAPEKTSIDMQLAACRIRAEEMARREGKRLVIVGVWKDEGVSGTIAADQRPELSKALQAAREGKMHMLLSSTDDRYVRLARHGSDLVTELEKYRVQYQVCDMEYLYDEDGKMLPESWLIQAIRGFQSEADRRRILQKTADGMRGLAERGKAPIRSTTPFGYTIRQKWEALAGRCTPEEVGTYAIVPEQAEAVRGMFDRMAAGASLRAVVRWLQDELRIPSKTGLATWAPRTIHRIITDTLYKGIGSFGKTKSVLTDEVDAKGKRVRYLVPGDPNKLVTFSVPAVVTPELWQAANDQLKRNQAMQSGAPDVRYLLSGFLRCPSCGSAMCGHGCNDAKRTRYYRCHRVGSDTNRAKRDDAPRCMAPHIPCLEIDSLVGKTLAETVLRQKCLSSAMERFQIELRSAHSTGGDGLIQRRESLRKQWEAADKAHHAAQTAIERILLMDPEADLARFIAAQKMHRERRDALAAQIADLGAVDTDQATTRLLSADANALAAYVCGMLSRLPEMLESPVLSPAEKRFILDGAVAQIVPVNETPDKKRFRRWGIEIELRQNLLADALAKEAKPPVTPSVSGELLPIPGRACR